MYTPLKVCRIWEVTLKLCIMSVSSDASSMLVEKVLHQMGKW